MEIRIFYTNEADECTSEEIEKMRKQLNRFTSGRHKELTYDTISEFASFFIADIKKEYTYKSQKSISKISGISEPTLSKMQTRVLKERALIKYLLHLIPCYLQSLYYDSDSNQFKYGWRKEPVSYEDKTTVSPDKDSRAIYFLCYRWKHDGLAISFLKISLEGRAVYSIYEIVDNNDEADPKLLYQQKGNAQLTSDNLEINVRREDNRFLTTILAFTGPSINSLSDIARQKTDLLNFNKGVFIGSYITISERGRPTVGNMVLRQVNDLESAINVFKNYQSVQNIRKNSHNLDYKKHELSSIDLLNDSFSEQICTFLHNRRLGTDQFNLPRLEEPVPYMYNAKTISNTYAGIYEVYYWSEKHKMKRNTICQIFPSGQSRFIEQKDDKLTPSNGFFRYTPNKTLIGQFDYLEQSDFFRLTILLKSGKTLPNNRYSFEGDFIYNGTSQNSSGTIKLIQKSLDYLKIEEFINDKEIEDAGVAQPILVSSAQDLSKPYGYIERFEGIYECYASSSSSQEQAVEMFPIKIEANGKVQLRSRSSLYFGQASLTNGFLSIVITHKKDGSCPWRHLLFRVGDFTRNNFRYSVGAGTRNNLHHQPRYGIELLFPSKLSFTDSHFGFMDCVNSLFSNKEDNSEKFKLNNIEYSLSELENLYADHKTIFQAIKMFFANDGNASTKFIDEKTIDLLDKSLKVFQDLKDLKDSKDTKLTKEIEELKLKMEFGGNIKLSN